MQLFKLPTSVFKYETFDGFMEAFELNEKDLVLTHRFLYEPFMKDKDSLARFIMQEDYGTGEPSDIMMNAILKDAKEKPFNRVIAIGGGTVLDIAKLLTLKDLDDVVNAFEKTVPLEKDKTLVCIPTTCGTGSEVTNITIAELTRKQTKMGLAVDPLYPDQAVLVPELLKGLPFKFYVYSSIDALIHAIESYVSPKSNPYTELFSMDAIESIIDIYQGIIQHGEDYRFERLSDMAVASNYAGIAFGITGVGAVHALSYPLGGMYHVPHGEANYQFFTEVFKLYQAKHPSGKIAIINKRLAELLHCEESKVYEALEDLLGNLLGKNQLSSYGMKEEEKESFTDSVLVSQQRLLANCYVPLSREDILGVYQRLY